MKYTLDTTPITCYSEQGSEGWHADRVGVATASMYRVARSKTGGLTAQQQAYVNAILRGNSADEAKAIAGYKAAPKAEAIEKALAGEKVGEFSDASKRYAFTLACERITGKTLGRVFETWEMKRGRELEPIGIQALENRLGVMIDRCSLVKTYDSKFGASADGSVSSKTGVELKCLIGPESLSDVLLANDISFYIDQIQGGMWVTGKTHWIYGMFCPDLAAANADLYWRVIRRDDNYIEALEADMIEFDSMVEDYRARLLTATTDDPDESALDEVLAAA